MKRQKLKISLVGCGRIAKRHAELLIHSLGNEAELISVCDTNFTKLNSFAKNYRVPGYISIDEMMQQHSPDIVSVLTESGNHAEHVLSLEKFNVNVIVEKPMALKVSDANQMVQAFKGKKERLFVVKQNRFNKPVAYLKKQIEKGILGSPLVATARVRWCRDQTYYNQADWRGTWKMDGGVLANQAIHHVDLLQWLAGDVQSVFAKSSTFLANIEAEDTLVAVIQFKNGALGTIEATTAVRPIDLEGSVSVLGSKGSAEIGGFAANKLLHFNLTDLDASGKVDLEDFSNNPPDVYGFGHKLFYQHVFDCLNNNKISMLEGDEGLKSLKIINAIYKSIETGLEVRLGDSDLSSRLGG